MNVEVVFFYLNNYFIYKNWLLDEIFIKFKNRNLMDFFEFFFEFKKLKNS